MPIARLSRLALCAIFAALSGCGGGGGTDSASPASPAPSPPSAPDAPEVVVIPDPAPAPEPTAAIVNNIATSGRHGAPQIVFNDFGVGLAVWVSGNGDPGSDVDSGWALWHSVYRNGSWSPESPLFVSSVDEFYPDPTNGIAQFFAVAAASDSFIVVWQPTGRIGTSAPDPVYARIYRNDVWSDLQAINGEMSTHKNIKSFHHDLVVFVGDAKFKNKKNQIKDF